jgi:hypothetical protein
LDDAPIIDGLLKKPHSLAVTKQITTIIIKQPHLLKDLLHVLKSDSISIKQKASWPLSHIAVVDSSLFSPYLNEILKLITDTSHPAVRRNALKVLEQIATLPEKYHAKALDTCFLILKQRDEPVAIRVYAMSILGRLCEVYPELRFELQAIIEEEMPYSSAGFKSRGKKVLQQLRTLSR